MKKLALILALALGMSSLVPAQSTEPFVITDAAGQVVSIGGLAPGVAVVMGVIGIGLLAFAITQVNGNEIIVTPTATGTL